jgi:DNA-binding transcriptional ArsR family regulator
MTGPVPAAALDALGDPNRRAILEILATGPSSVQAIADQLPISRPAVSRHLRLLKEAQLVTDEANGAQRLYQLRADGVDAIRSYFERLWGEATWRYRMAVHSTRGRSRR